MSIFNSYIKKRINSNCALDPLGYHCVTCKRGGNITTRYNILRNVVYSTFQRAGLSAHSEVGCGWGQDNSRTRPAYILVTNWDCGSPAAFDITSTVASPLNSINMLEAGMYQGASAKVGTVTCFSNHYLRHIIYIIGKSKKYTFQRYLMFIVISFVASTTLFQRCNMK